MKAAIYIRVSTEEQAKEGFSLEAQRDRCVQYIESQGYQLVKVYMEDGYSAKNMNRPHLQELIEDSKKKLFNLVVVYKLDRLTRSVLDSQVILNHFEKNGVKFKSTMEEFETITAGGRMFLNLMTVIAQWEREQIAERVILGMSKRAEMGLRNNYRLPYGYKLDDQGQMVIDEETAPIVRLMFDRYAKGIGSRKIKDELLSRGYHSSTGTPINEKTIMDILVNPAFLGITHWKPKDAPESERIVREGTHPALVSQELFDRVQSIITRKRSKDISRSSYDYPFSGILKCGHCGNPLHGHTTRKKLVDGSYKVYRSYHCYGKHNLRVCKVPDLNEKKMESLFFEELVQHLRFNLERETYESAEVKEERKDYAKERKRIERKIAESRKIMDNWAYAMGKGAMPVDQYLRLVQQEEVNVKRLEAQLAEVQEEDVVAVKASYEDAIELLKNLQSVWPDLSREDRKQSVQILFKRIDVHHDGEWDIINHEFDG